MNKMLVTAAVTVSMAAFAGCSAATPAQPAQQPVAPVPAASAPANPSASSTASPSTTASGTSQRTTKPAAPAQTAKATTKATATTKPASAKPTAAKPTATKPAKPTTSAITLGVPIREGWVGLGTVKPSVISFNGDPTSRISSVTWSSWGGATALGTGKAYYVGPEDAVVNAKLETANVKAWGLGTCKGRTVYTRVSWTFPAHPGTEVTAYNTCTGYSAE